MAGEKGLIYYSPCDTPIRYSIGTIDEGFTTTREELLTDSRKAANIWSAAVGKTLFEYDPNSEFTINLVYDSRQELTSKISAMDQGLKQKQEEIDPRIEEFEKKQADFEKRVKEFNELVSSWNSKGGAPREEYDKIIATQKALSAESQDLSREAESLGQSTKEYNLEAQKLNKTIDDYQDVLNVKPEEGLYEQEGGKRKISIFIDIDEDEFLHTLTHEFGHAVGLDHDKDNTSIMYYQTTTNLKPSGNDIKNLQYICRRRTFIEETITRMKLLAEVLSQRFNSKFSQQ